jgi:acetyl-CoA carboxylase biotin carboxyl carrier protein
VELDFSELRALLTVLNQTDINELTIKSADFELTVRKGGVVSDRVSEGVAVPSTLGLPPQTPAVSSASPGEAVTPVPETYRREIPPSGGNNTAAPPAAAVPPPGESKWVAINSPMVGTFYRAPAPNEPPFVDVGDRIRIGQAVCIIEAMKLMNEIEAEVSGQVMEILVQNGSPVEYGQPLMRVNPD